MSATRTILRPRSQMPAIERRLTAAMNQAADLTLSLREISVLMTFISAAKRLAVQQPGSAMGEEVAALRLEVQKTTAAWESAERRLWTLDKASVRDPLDVEP